MKKILVGFIVLMSVFSLNSCFSILEKYKKVENKAAVLLNIDGSVKPIYRKEDDYQRKAEAGDGYKIATYKKIKEKTTYGNNDVTLLTIHAGTKKNLEKFNDVILDKTLVEVYKKITDSVKNKLNKKYSWIKAVSTATVDEVTSEEYKKKREPKKIKTEKNLLGLDALSFSEEKEIGSMGEKSTSQRFFDGDLTIKEDWVVEIKFTKWFIYSKVLLHLYLVGGLPVADNNYQKIGINIKVYDKKSKSTIYNQTTESDVAMINKSLHRIGENSLPEDIKTWENKTFNQIDGLIDTLITKMDK